MKKFVLIGFLVPFLLTACSAQKTDSNSSNSAKTSSSSLSSSEEKLQKEFIDAMTNNDATFPQLSKNLTDDEAQVRIHTNQGDIVATLFPKYAPLAVENFLTHAKEGYYNGLLFHRVIKDFMIQTGDPKGDGTGGESIWKGKDDSKDSGAGFKNEYSPYLYNLRGALAMANAGPDTNGSQFFINQNPKDSSSQLPTNRFPAKIIQAYKDGGNPSLDGSYTVFGQVVEGMDVVDKIADEKTDEQDRPKNEVKIESIDILKDYHFHP